MTVNKDATMASKQGRESSILYQLATQSTVYARHERRRAMTLANRNDPRPAVVRIAAGLPGWSLWFPPYHTIASPEPTPNAAAVLGTENSDKKGGEIANISDDSTTTVSFSGTMPATVVDGVTPMDAANARSTSHIGPVIATGVLTVLVGTSLWNTHYVSPTVSPFARARINGLAPPAPHATPASSSSSSALSPLLGLLPASTTVRNNPASSPALTIILLRSPAMVALTAVTAGLVASGVAPHRD